MRSVVRRSSPSATSRSSARRCGSRGLLPSLLFVTLTCGSLTASRGAHGKAPASAAPASDFCARALELLNVDNGALESCIPFLPDQYWVVARGSKGGYAGTVIVDEGLPDARRGCAAGVAWLRRIRVYELETINPVALVEGLEYLGALPEGFKAAHLTDHEDRRGTTRFALTPFRLELRRMEEAVVADGAATFLGGAEHGGGARPPQRRAILTGDAAYRFTWAIERRRGGGAWQGISTTPCP